MVIQNLAFEKEAHDAVMGHVLKSCEIQLHIFSLSHQKYQLNRMCAEQMSGSLTSVNRIFERQKLNQRRKIWLQTETEKKPAKEKVLETLKAIEVKKAETLSELSNPFKAAREKFETVLDLEEAKSKLTDYIEVDQGFSSELLFDAACEHYQLMKS